MKTFKTKSGLELTLENLKGKDYLPAAQRILWFRSEHPFGKIKTERLSESPEQITYRATISVTYPEALNVYIEIANADKTLVIKNTTDYEKCETMAIGRALALCGFGTQFAVDDLDEGDDLADSPIEPKVKEPEVKKALKILPPHKEEVTPAKAPEDQVFLIGKDIKGKKFSQLLNDKGFLKWVNDTITKDGAKSQPQLIDFHRYARAHGAYRL